MEMKKLLVILIGLVGMFSCQFNSGFKSKKFSDVFPTFMDSEFTAIAIIDEHSDTIHKDSFSLQIKECINNSMSEWVKFGYDDKILLITKNGSVKEFGYSEKCKLIKYYGACFRLKCSFR